jgi:hypothetical protein
MRSRLSALGLVALLPALAGCSASPRPVFYPNARLAEVGEAQVQQDIDACMAAAEAAGVSRSGGTGQAAGNVAKTAAIGGAAGAAGGAVRGHAGRGAAVGAAAGAAGGTMRELFRTREPDPVFKNFVDRCLRDKGYDPIGWK